MECHICRKAFAGRRKPICASCVQALLYTPRLEQASALLSREKAHTHAEAVVRPGNDGILAALPEDADLDAIERGVKSHCIERDTIAAQAVKARVQAITAKAAQLKKEIESHRAFIVEQKQKHVLRRKHIAKAHEDLRKKQPGAIEPVQAAIKKAAGRLKKVQDRTVEARTYICRVATSLSGLQKRKYKDAKSQFYLGFLPIPDLRDIIGTSGKLHIQSVDKDLYEPHQIMNASLENVCHLLTLCCHYLSIRLPAEILLPEPDSPHFAVVPLDSSYKVELRSIQAKAPSEAISRFARPRPLHLPQPYLALQKADPKAAAYFREAVVLLAYDIVWLARSQGLHITSAFEDITDMGRNLHAFLPQSNSLERPNLLRTLTSATAPKKSTDLASQSPIPRFGLYSHNSTHHNLASHQVLTIFGPGSNWDTSIPKLVDQLQKYLRRELQRAEWDVIEQTEWDEDLEEDKPVLVGGTRKLDSKGAVMSVMTVKPSDDEALPGLARAGKAPSGWTKVRGRPEG